MIQVSKLSLAYGQQIVLDNVTLSIQQDERIALMGRNGSGKSTLLKIIAGQYQPDGGVVAIERGKTIAYMPQEVVLTSKKSIIDEALTAFELIYALEQKIAQLEPLIQDGKATQDMIDQYAHAHDQLNQENPAHARAQTERMLVGLGFAQKDFDKPVQELSVGWKMRIVLAKLLLKNADFYLFDEPTNHLDIVAKEWFLDFLKTSKFGFLLVCHDRYFLEQTCQKLLDLERGKATFYYGNYESYLTSKQEALKNLEMAAAQQEKEIKRKLDTANRFRAKSSKAKMAQSILKSVAKIERIELPPSPRDVHFSFDPITKPGRMVLQVHNVSHSFGSKQLFKNVTFHIERGQKVALVAPNGVGKTTLFNLIAGKLSLQQGTIELGYNVEHAIFDQDQNLSLDGKRTVLENVIARCPKKSEQTIRSFLGNFLFSGDTVDKKVQILSGGEKNRVGMVSTLLQDANLLLLDEPTNHLDIQTKEILLHALRQSQATMLFVSHDLYFVDNLATQIIELTNHGAFVYHGNYQSYHVQKSAQEQSDNSGVGKAKGDNAQLVKGKINHELSKQSRNLEKKIDKIESQIKKIEYSFADLEYGSPAFDRAQQKLQELNDEYASLLTQWEDLQVEIEKGA